MQRKSVASVCLLVGSGLVTFMGLFWGLVVLLGLAVGAASVGAGAVATTFFGYEMPVELLYTGGGLYVIGVVAITLLSSANLLSGGFGLFTAVRGIWTGRMWGLRAAAVVQILLALVFGVPGAITMNPLALVWAVVLVLAIATLVVIPRAERVAEAG